MEAVLQKRFEGSIFFIYDRDYLKKEDDRLEDAIVYFYPHTMPMDNQCRICGQLMGVVQFSFSMFNSYPAVFRFENEKFVVKHVGKYSFVFAGSSFEPESALRSNLEQLFNLFTFYHGSIERVQLECDNDSEKFTTEIRVIFEQYLALIRNYGDNLPSVFNPIPYLPLKDDPNFYFLKASHMLESCQRRPQIIAGSILYNRYILCSQLTDTISRYLLLLKPNQQNHPAVPIETEYQLPFGVRLFNVYLKRNDLKQILLYNHDNSPYQSQSKAMSLSFHCCCTGHKTPRSRTPRMQEYTTVSEEPHVDVTIDEILTKSERDPFSSSSGSSGPILCKVMLEDLLLRGFKCCKCIEETDGEFENGSSSGNVEECVEDKSKNNRDSIPDIEEGTELGTHSRKSSRSRTPQRSRNYSRNSTLETESGIEVTGSDFQSSAATHFDQRCQNFIETDANSPEGHLREQQTEGNYRTVDDDGEKRGETDRIVEENEEIISVGNDVDKTENKENENPALNKNEIITSDNHQNIIKNENYQTRDNTADITVHGSKEFEENHDEILSHEKYTKKLVENYTGPLKEGETEESEICNNHLNDDIDDGSCESSVERLGDISDDLSIKEHSNNFDITGNEGDISGPSSDSDASKLEEIHKKLYNQNLNIVSSSDKLSSSEDSYRTPDEILDTYYSEVSSDNNDVKDKNIDVDTIQCGVNDLNDARQGEGNGGDFPDQANEDFSSLGTSNEKEGSNNGEQKKYKDCCEVDGLIHANLFVQAHSEIVLILLAKCDLYQNEDVIRSLWSTSLSRLGELDILMKNSAKENDRDSQGPLNLLLYDNFDKTISGSPREPVYAPDHVFCETAKTLHNHFNNAPQLSDVTLRNFLSGIHCERTLSREAYFQEPMGSLLSSNIMTNISGNLPERMKECIAKDHGLHLV